MTRLLQVTPNGFFCERGGFYVDPWKPVDRGVITHAHADHARWGTNHYLAAESSRHVLRIRLGEKANLQFLPFGSSSRIGGVTVTFYPAGHILGSAQVLIESRGERVIVSGDYKRQADVTCTAFEPIRCHTFVTESTFGLPIYKWPDPQSQFDGVNDWWRKNQTEGKTSLLLAYALGKAQRLLAGVDPSIGPIYTHGAVEKLNAGYRASGIQLPATQFVGNAEPGTDWQKALVIAPPSAAGSPWVRRFGRISTAMASGWMQIRGTRRRRSVDRGFVLSDHVDWPALMKTIKQTQAEEIWVTHGYSDIVARHLNESGMRAQSVQTEFIGEWFDDQQKDPHFRESDTRI